MVSFLSTRRRQAEWLDDPQADPSEIRASLAFIRRINRAMGYTRAVLQNLGGFSAGWKQGQTIRIVDVGTGSADIPMAILDWADQHGFDIRVVGVDLSAAIAGEAAAAADDSRLQIVRGDALDLPFDDASFDYAITSMFLHHLDDEQACRALSEISRVARKGVIVSDLLRRKHAYVFIWLCTFFSRPMIKHDARVSVAQAFNKAEILQVRDRSGLGFAKYFNHLGHRFVLAGEREGMRIEN